MICQLISLVSLSKNCWQKKIALSRMNRSNTLTSLYLLCMQKMTSLCHSGKDKRYLITINEKSIFSISKAEDTILYSRNMEKNCVPLFESSSLWRKQKIRLNKEMSGILSYIKKYLLLKKEVFF